jgi:hypoxanthine phosphoribosyltransferase
VPVLDANIESVIITADQIRDKIAELAARIDADYVDREVLLVGVLKGAAMFMSDLARACSVRRRWSSWRSAPTARRTDVGGGAHPQGPRPRHLRRARARRRGHYRLRVDPVLVAEEPPVARPGVDGDRLPTAQVRRRQGRAGRQVRRVRDPEAFVVGYGLDYAEQYRGLPYIGILKSSVYGG